MPRPASWTALLAGLALACGGGSAAPPEPPRPQNLADFDPRAVERIEAALAEVRATPRRGRTWADLGMTYSSERQHGLAAECFRVAARLEPEQPKWPYHEAIALAQTDALAAITAMERALALEPGYPPGHARLGQFRLDLGDLDGAERDFRASVRLDPTYPGGRVGLARVALQRDQNDAAIALLEELLREDPEDRTFRQLLTVARRETGGGEELSAESVTNEDERKVWNDPWALETRAFRREPAMIQVVRLLMDGGGAEALTLLDEERARGSSREETALLYANALRQVGRVDDALEELESVLAREPENTQALMLQAQLLDDRGDVEEAVAVLERISTIQPTFGAVFAAKGRKLGKLKRHDPAVEAYRRAIELGIDDAELRAALGNSLVVLKRWGEARAVFEELAAERPESGDTWLQLAITLVRTGALDEAEDVLARAVAAGNAGARLTDNVRSALEEARARRAAKALEQPGTERQ